MVTTLAGAPTQPRYFVNSWAARTGQRLGARVIDSAFALLAIALVLVIGPHGRPLAQDLEILALVTAFESILLARLGATAGMQALGIRVAVLDSTAKPSWLAACRRTVPVALCYTLPIPGLFAVLVMPFALLVSLGMSPLRRGFHDRLSGTIVVQRDAPALITTADLDTWWQPGQAAVMSPWGRVPGLYERRRARAHRLDGSWWLAGAIVVATVASVGLRAVPLLWLWLALGWMVLVVIDETRWLSKDGTTPGHAQAGYRVVDMASGAPPTRGRALARSAVLAPLLYLPPLQLLLGLWVNASALNRGPHDLVGHTIVVEPDYVPPRFAARAAPVWMTWPADQRPVVADVIPPPPVSRHHTAPPPPAPPPPFTPGPF